MSVPWPVIIEGIAFVIKNPDILKKIEDIKEGVDEQLRALQGKEYRTRRLKAEKIFYRLGFNCDGLGEGHMNSALGWLIPNDYRSDQEYLDYITEHETQHKDWSVKHRKTNQQIAACCLIAKHSG